MSPPPRTYFGLALGALMVGLGLYVVLRLMATAGRPLTGRLWLDVAFAVFFLVRGGLYLYNLGRRRQG